MASVGPDAVRRMIFSDVRIEARGQVGEPMTNQPHSELREQIEHLLAPTHAFAGTLKSWAFLRDVNAIEALIASERAEAITKFVGGLKVHNNLHNGNCHCSEDTHCGGKLEEYTGRFIKSLTAEEEKE